MHHRYINVSIINIIHESLTVCTENGRTDGHEKYEKYKHFLHNISSLTSQHKMNDQIQRNGTKFVTEIIWSNAKKEHRAGLMVNR